MVRMSERACARSIACAALVLTACTPPSGAPTSTAAPAMHPTQRRAIGATDGGLATRAGLGDASTPVTTLATSDGGARPAPVEWTEAILAECSVAVRTRVRAARQDKDVANAFGTVKMLELFADHAWTTTRLQCFRVPDATPLSQIVKDQREELEREVEGIVDEQPISLGAFPGRALHVRPGYAPGEVRVFLVNGWAVRLAVFLSPTDGPPPDPPDHVRIFDSLRVVGSP
jgi:hypothetical protein